MLLENALGAIRIIFEMSVGIFIPFWLAICLFECSQTRVLPCMTIANFDDLRAHIVALADELPKKLAQAARYALAHPDDIALGTAASIAKAANVQPSTLVRLAQQLGFRGFSDFQSVFRSRLKVRASSYPILMLLF
jgi:hypothetical protein